MENIDKQIENHKNKIIELEKRKTILVLKKQVQLRQKKIDEIFFSIKKKLIVDKNLQINEKKECTECRNTTNMHFKCDNHYCCNF